MNLPSQLGTLPPKLHSVLGGWILVSELEFLLGPLPVRVRARREWASSQGLWLGRFFLPSFCLDTTPPPCLGQFPPGPLSLPRREWRPPGMWMPCFEGQHHRSLVSAPGALQGSGLRGWGVMPQTSSATPGLDQKWTHSSAYHSHTKRPSAH